VFQTIVRGRAREENDFGINPLTGKPFFSDPIFAHSTDSGAATTVAIPLTLEPQIPLSFRAIGWDAAAAGEVVPAFFIHRGAAQRP
jgi:hypothetical protein